MQAQAMRRAERASKQRIKRRKEQDDATAEPVMGLLVTGRAMKRHRDPSGTAAAQQRRRGARRAEPGSTAAAQVGLLVDGHERVRVCGRPLHATRRGTHHWLTR